MFERKKMKKTGILPGTWYFKIEAPSTLWIVSRIIDFPKAGRHVQLYQKDHPPRTLTVAVSALMDHRMFRTANAA